MAHFELKDKTVVVTGAASGIGLESARAFARRGANVALLDLNAEPLEAIKRELIQSGVKCIAVACNVADENAVRAAAEAVQNAMGPPDVLINNAGIGYLGAFMETAPEAWRRVLDINVMGVVHCTRAFLPAMQAKGGARTIVNVASAAGFSPTPSMSAYAASKHAVVGLSEVLAMELDGTPISVLIVAPGIINTNIVRVRSNVAPSITDAQIEKLQDYYAKNGCHPSVVAEGIVKAVQERRHVLAVGPSAKAMTGLMRLSRRLTRRMVIDLSKRAGFV